MLSRRAVLLGGVGVVAAGGVAFVELGPRKVLHHVGAVSSPDHRVPASNWPVVEHQIDSVAMKRSVTWAIAVPPTTPTGVVVCLHGRNNDHRHAFDALHIHDVVASLGLTLAVVSVDGGSDSYWHPRADGTDALAMVTDELLAAVDAELAPTLPRAVIGWSMGGYGSLLVGERAPDRFRAVVAASPALWPAYGNSSAGAFDDAADFARYDVFAGVGALSSMTAVRIDCGTDDGFVSMARKFSASLARPNPGRFSDGFHDDAYWRSVAPSQLATIGGALSA